MALLVVRPGLNTTVQDRGRPGYREFGVPVGGAFDRASIDLANALVGNDPADAALEMTLVGGTYRAEVTMAIALAGAPMSAVIRPPSGPDRSLAIPQSATLLAGEELVIGGGSVGARAYLAVRGGWRTPLVLGSRSTESRLDAGAILPALTSSIPSRRPVDWPWLVGAGSPGIRVVDGPDADPTRGDARLLESAGFRVSDQSDRMGLRLEGATIPLMDEPERPSAPVAPGAVQVMGGRAIALGVAGGTMGGYLHLAHVISADLDRLGQLRPGDSLRFVRVEVEDARRIDRLDRVDRDRRLTILRALGSSVALET